MPTDQGAREKEKSYTVSCGRKKKGIKVENEGKKKSSNEITARVADKMAAIPAHIQLYIYITNISEKNDSPFLGFFSSRVYVS